MDYSKLRYRIEPRGSSSGDEYPVDPYGALYAIQHYLWFKAHHDDLNTVYSRCESIADSYHCRIIWL